MLSIPRPLSTSVSPLNSNNHSSSSATASTASTTAATSSSSSSTFRGRQSPTPSEQSYQTTTTHPVSLFSASQADIVAADSLSIATTVTNNGGENVHDGGDDDDEWTASRSHYHHQQPPSFLSRQQQPYGYHSPSLSVRRGPTLPTQKAAEKDLYEFLTEAQLEHYYTALTSHLKVCMFHFSVGRAIEGGRGESTHTHIPFDLFFDTLEVSY